MGKMDIKARVERIAKNNARLLEQCKLSDDLEYSRTSILIRDQQDYARIKDELSKSYKIVELDASEITFVKKVALSDEEHLSVNNGPGTKKSVMTEKDFIYGWNIEKPVAYYSSVNYDFRVNPYLRSMFEAENTLIVLTNLDKIENPANRTVFIHFLISDKALPALPFVVVLDDVDGSTFRKILDASKDSFMIM